MIKSKKLIAVFTALVLILLTAFPASSFAAQSVSNPDAGLCGTLGMLVGDGNGLTNEYLAKTPTRIQAALLFLRLKGLESEATNYKGASNFDDVNKASWAENIMAYMKAHPELGMVGVGDNKFSPDTYINAQAYYKILLEALGYKTGIDFQWDNTIAFANSLGLYKAANTTNFTLSDLSTATVEALKANAKGSVDTLAGTLVKNGVFNSTQQAALVSANIGLVMAGVQVSIKNASTIGASFTSKLTDLTKVSFEVKKDGLVVDSLTGKWNDAGTELSISRQSNYDAGTYSIKILYDNKVLDTKTLGIESERIASITFTPEIILRTSDIKGEVSYKALNQYGEDISKSALIKNLVWASNADSVTIDTTNTKLIVIKNGTTTKDQLKDITKISIAGYDSVSNFTVSKELTVSDGYGLVKDIKFLGIKNKDGKTDITVDTKDKFYIEYEAYDESGKTIDTYSILSNVANFGVYSSNPYITAHIVRDPDNTSKALIEIDTHTASGTAEISGVVMLTGKKATITVNVLKGAELTDFAIESPGTGLSIGERVEIPFKAYDQNGNIIKDYDLINGKVLFVVVGSATSSLVGERSQTGEYILTGYFDQVTTYKVKVIIIQSNKSTDYSITTKAAALPTTIASVSRDIVSDAIVENGVIKANFTDSPAFKILDQNGSEVDLGNNNVYNGKNIYIYATSSDSSKVAVNSDKNIAYKDKEIILTGGSTKGTATITFELCSDDDFNYYNGKEVLDVKDYTVTNIDRKEILDYTFADIPVLYANPDLSSTDRYSTISAQKQQYAHDIKVYGKIAGGEKAALDPVIGAGRNILTMNVIDSKKFDIDLVNGKILAKPYGKDSTVSDKLTATILGGGGVVTTVSIDVTSSNEAPYAKGIEAVIAPDTDIKRSKDTVSMSLATFNSYVSGRELRSFNANGNSTQKSYLYFEIKDQYGVVGLTPSYFALTKTQGSGTVSIDPLTGLISGTAAVGDQYSITAVTNNGLTKAITVNIQ